MINNRIYLCLCIFVVLLFLASCGGGGGSKSPTPAVTTPPAATDTGGDEDAAKPPSPSPYTEAPRTVTDTEYVMVKTGDTPEEFASIAAKFGYDVEYKNGNWLKVRVPDGNIDYAITELRKEYHVFDVQPLRHYVMPREEHVNTSADVKLASYLPFDCLYNDLIQLPTGVDPDTGDFQYGYYFYGQRPYVAPMGFEGAWDVAWRDDIRAVPVTIAVIDAGIWHDSGTGGVHPELASGRVDANSGTVAGDGTFTPDEYFYELDGESAPYRTTGHRVTGLFLSTVNNIISWTMPVGDPPQDAPFLCSMTPVTPFANVMIIKTGHVDGDNWAFSDDEIVSSINHAVTNGANIILLDMWAPTVSMPPVSAPLQDAITAARDGDVLVIAPAGMADLDNSSENIDEWTWGVPGDVTGVTPAAGTGVVSVMATGFEQIDMDADPTPAPGYVNTTYPNIGDAWNEIAEFSYTGGTMAAVGWGLSWWNNFFTYVIYGFMDTDPSATSVVDVTYAAAYVAGAASIAYQALVNANGGAAPADVDTIIENLLLDEALTISGDESFLAAGSVAHVAANGGYDKYIESINITTYSLSGAIFNAFGNAFLEVGQGTQLTAGMTSNGGDYEIVVGWGDGTIYPDTYLDDGNYAPYTPGDPLDYTYTEAGSYELTILAHEAVNDTYDEVSFWVFVYNPLSAHIEIANVLGGVGTNLLVDDAYQAASNVSYEPVTGNTVTCDWDFNWDGVAGNFSVDIADREEPLFCYGDDPGGGGAVHYLGIGPGDFTIGLRVTQTRRPTTYYQVDVTVTTE